MSDSAAERVIAELEGIAGMIHGLMERIRERRTIPPHEVEDMQAELAALKQRLERGRKYGTVDGSKRAQTRWESAFFVRAVSNGRANLSIRANSHPIQANWIGGLMGLDADIRLPLANLKAEAGSREF